MNKSVDAKFDVFFNRCRSERWSRSKFIDAIHGSPKNPLLPEISRRRSELNDMPAQNLHSSYQAKSGGGGPKSVRSKIISLPPSYGKVLYLLASMSKAHLLVEAGSGFGVSSMYLAAAARSCGGILFSFEIAQYADIARDSVSLICPKSRVINADFNYFNSHLSADSNVDFAFIDAKHDADSILRGHKNLKGWLSSKAMIVVDDISYSESSKYAWRKLVRDEEFGFAASVNGRLGVLAY